MKRYLLTVQYLGRNYQGFQRQKNEPTIQKCLEDAMFKVFQQEIEVFASGRTDAGVNAIAQTVHFDAETKIEDKRIPFALNQNLPDDVKVTSCKVVPNDFHARFSVRKKTYEYKLYVSEHILPILDEHALQVKFPLNIELMKKASKILEGEHDFKAFASSGNNTKDFVRRIYEIKVSQKEREMTISVSGNGFLYNMVRIIVGTLIEVGQGKRTVENVKQLLLSKDRKNAGYLVPAKGLFLKEVKY